MAEFDFQTITAAQALAFNAAVDSLVSVDPVTSFAVSFNDLGSQFTLTDSVTGHAVVFGAAAYGAGLRGDLGNTLKIGSPDYDFIKVNSGVVFGGPGGDVIVGANVAHGGGGSDTFVPYTSSMRIADWDVSDRLIFNIGQVAAKADGSNYIEATRPDSASALTYANSQMATGKYDFVVVSVGANLEVYADFGNINAASPYYGAKVVIEGRGLDDFSVANLPAKISPIEDYMGGGLPFNTGANGYVTGNMDLQHLSSLVGVPIVQSTAGQFLLSAPKISLSLSDGTIGNAFTYDSNGQLTGGNTTSIDYESNGFIFKVNVVTSAANFGKWVATDATQEAFATVLAGNDILSGRDVSDLIRGYGGDDVIYGAGGADTLFGGAGDDFIFASTRTPETAARGATYLRGEDGNDNITGGADHDDINGNAGNDTAYGGAGDDWVVGGKDNDLLYGETGNDIVYGNLGADTLYGGDGADWVRGGQGDDSISGGAGDDLIYGDRGDDTIRGGTGADSFRSFSGAGKDRILDFSSAEGDHVQLDPGTAYTVSQVGADTVVDMGNGDQMILVGVTLSSLPHGWIGVG